jgi:CheY-like chemotaxis protein
MMPDMDGPATLAHLRERPATVEVPIVFMTARAQVSDIEHYMSLGAAGVIAKPFDPMTLPSRARDYASRTWDEPAGKSTTLSSESDY